MCDCYILEAKTSKMKRLYGKTLMKPNPKYVYVVLNTGRDTGPQIVGCFYSKKDAEQWAGSSSNIVVHKLAVS